jgi:hypothetical protein
MRLQGLFTNEKPGLHKVDEKSKSFKIVKQAAEWPCECGHYEKSHHEIIDETFCQYFDDYDCELVYGCSCGCEEYKAMDKLAYMKWHARFFKH